MTLVLGLDVETTGLDAGKDEIIEIGAALWCTERNKVMETYSAFIYTPLSLSKDVRDITGIDNAMLDEHGEHLIIALAKISHLASKAAYLVAHNAPFDRGFITAALESVDVGISEHYNKPWIDTKIDIPYQGGKGEGTLTLIAAHHGFLNPFPHRALFDVMTMLKVLGMYDFAEVERYATAPNVTLGLKFDYDPSGQRQTIARSLGYHWAPEVKQWRKQAKQFMVDDHIKKADYQGLDCLVVA